MSRRDKTSSFTLHNTPASTPSSSNRAPTRSGKRTAPANTPVGILHQFRHAFCVADGTILSRSPSRVRHSSTFYSHRFSRLPFFLVHGESQNYCCSYWYWRYSHEESNQRDIPPIGCSEPGDIRPLLLCASQSRICAPR